VVPVPGNQAADRAEAISQAAKRALLVAIKSDEKALPGALADIQELGAAAVLGSVWAWSSVTLKCLTGLDGPVGDGWFLELEFLDEDGRRVDIRSAASPGQQAAAQMVTLYGNSDHDTAAAICGTAWEGDEGTSLLVASVTLAAMLAREDPGGYLREPASGSAP
jgi:hypothetical protein